MRYPLGLPPFGVAAAAHDFKSPFVTPAVHDNPHHLAAYVGAQSLDIGNAEGTRDVLQRIGNQVRLGTTGWALPAGALLELAIGRPQG